MCKGTIFKYKYQTFELELLYIIISETIDDIISKKKDEIKSIEEATCVDMNEGATNKIYDIHRQINYLNVCKHKIREYLTFVQNMEED